VPNIFRIESVHSFVIDSSLHSRVLVEKMLVPQLAKEFPAFYRIRSIIPPVPILSQMNPVQTIKPYFLKIHVKIILPPTPTTSVQISLTKILFSLFTSTMRATCPIFPIIFDWITLIIFGEEYNLK
jgi:hypothetical protein